MPRITKTFVESLLPPATGQKIYRDSDTKGFCLRMGPTCRAFIVEHTCGGKRIRLTIGHYPTMSVEVARAEAQRRIAEMQLGIMPADRKNDPTLLAVMDRFLEIRTLSPKSKDLYRRVICRSLPDWLDLPITAITKSMIQERHRTLVVKTANGTKGKTDADRTFHTLRVMLNFARSEFEIDGKPAIEVNPVRDALHWRWYGTNVRTGIIPDHKLKDFYAAVMAQPNKIARDFILLLIFTSLRRSEVSNLRWSNLNFEERTITIPAGYNKSQREHVLPMTEIVEAILESRKSLRAETDFVLPNRNAQSEKGHMCEPRAVLLRVRKEIGIDFIWHDLRRTTLSNCEKAGLPYTVIQKIANHKIRRDITDRYLILDVDYVRPYMEQMTERMLSLMNTTVEEWKKLDQCAGIQEPYDFGRATIMSELTFPGEDEDQEEEEFYW